MLGQHFQFHQHDPGQQIFAYLGISTPPDRETFLSALDLLGRSSESEGSDSNRDVVQ